MTLPEPSSGHTLSDLGVAALDLLKRGFRVVPVDAVTREPHVSYKGLEVSRAQVKEWWRSWPSASIGLRADGLFVVDVDQPESFERLLADLGIQIPAETPACQTNRGAHYYFRMPVGLRSTQRTDAFGPRYPGIDIKMGSGLVIAPPSRHHKGGRRYQWVSGRSLLDLQPQEAPHELLNALSLRTEQESCSPDSEDSSDLPLNPVVVREALCHIVEVECYECWLKVGMALHEGFCGDDVGLELWDEWSQGPEKRPAHNYEPDACHRKWGSFGSGGATVGVGTLVNLARTGGWNGGSGHLRAVEASPYPAITSPVVTPESDRVALARELVAQHPAGGRSLAISGPPGLSKSTQRAIHQQSLLMDGQLETAISAHKTRGRVDDIVSDQRIGLMAGEAAGRFRVVVFMGRGDDPSQGFWCRERGGDRYKLMTSRGLSPCKFGCPFQEVCSEESGSYLHDRAHAERQLQEPGKVFVVTTIDGLKVLWPHMEEVGRVGPSQPFEVTMDDPGESFGLFKDEKFDSRLLLEYREHIEAWLGPADPDVRREDGELAQVVLALVETLLNGQETSLAPVVERLDQAVRERQKVFLPSEDERLPWESPLVVEGGGFLQTYPPAFGRPLLKVLRSAVLGMPAPIKCEEGRVTIADPSEHLIQATKDGHVCFLAVGPIPGQLADALGVTSALSTWELHNQITSVRPPRADIKWRGTTERESKPNTADNIICEWVTTVAMHHDGKLGFLGTKNDREALASSLESGAHIIGHYGLDQAGTNAFEGVSLMIVRRYRPHPKRVTWNAAALQACMGQPPQATDDRWVLERRVCPRAGRASFVKVPSDPLEREVYRVIEAQDMLNAVGRCRPLSNPDCRIVIFDADPIEGVISTEVCGLVELDLIPRDEAGAILERYTRTPEVLARERAIDEAWEKDPSMSPDNLLKVISSEEPSLEFNIRHVADRIRSLERANCQTSTGGSIIYDRPGRGTLTLSSLALAYLENPGWIPGRAGLPALVARKCGLHRQQVSADLKVLREHRGMPPGGRTDYRQRLRRVMQAVEEVVGRLALGLRRVT